VDEVLINTHHLPEKVRKFTRNWTGKVRVHLSHEKELLGSAGTLDRNWDFVAGEESFLVCYADNLTDIDLTRLIRVHRKHSRLVTMALFRTDRPRECGIAELDDTGAIVGFEEKPASPKSALANGGIYAMRTEIRSRLPRKAPADIGFDLLPQCCGDMQGWLWDGLLMDIGSPAAYARANEAWAAEEISSRGL
jgi:mannose-1-phosphate guanylyltransferase